MTHPANFRYPGDHPTALGAAALKIDEAGVRVERTIQAVSLSRTALRGAWTMQATDLADADIGTLLAGLPAVRAAMGAAHDALVAHQTALIRIRAEIDDLETRFRQQSHVWESAHQDYQQLARTPETGASFQLVVAQATADAATAAQEDIWANYLRLVAEADTSAQTCADALAMAWDPQHRARRFLLNAPGAALMEHARISASSLNMLRIDAEVAEAGKLAADIASMDYMDGTDVVLQGKLARLHEIWDSESASGVFATSFYAKLGPGKTVDLLARIGTVMVPDGYLNTGQLTQALIHDLQADMANGLSAALQGIQYGVVENGGDGSLTDTTPGGLGAEWLHELMAKGRSTITVPFNGQPIQVLGYVPLMATLANGSNFSAGTLRALGDDMRDLELQHSIDNPLDVGDRVWASTATTRVRWNWASSGYDFPMGNDPFTSWTSAMVASPGASTTVLGTDKNLLDHLLNQRSWTVDDSPDTDDPAQRPYRTSDLHEPLQGLAVFGAALPIIIGDGSRSDDAGTAFVDVVQLLGTNDTNPRMDRGDFASTDWIAPELRPGLGNLLVQNVETVHDAFAGSDKSYNYSVVVADVGKDRALGGDGMPFSDRMAVAEAQLMSDRPALGDAASQDIDGQARLMATLAYGHTAADIGLQQRVDDEHNDLIDGATWTGHLFASGLGEVPVLGATAQYLADSLITRIGQVSQQDNSLRALNDASEWAASQHDLFEATVGNQAYAAALDQGWRPTDPALTLTDSNGQLRLFGQFTDREQTMIDLEWPGGFGQSPGGLASAKGDVFSVQHSLLATVLANKGAG